VADSIRTERLAPGVWLHHLVRTAGLLRAHVLDIDLSSRVTPSAQGRTDGCRSHDDICIASGAACRRGADRRRQRRLLPLCAARVPVGALVVDGRLIAGPINRPVLAFDARNAPFIGTLTASGALTSARGRVPIATWNRPSATAIGVVDAAWGQGLDSLARPTALQLVPISGNAPDRRYRVAPLPATHSGLARGDTLLLVGSARASVLPGDTVRLEASLLPIMPHTVVGGFPLLLRDSMIVPTVDSAGAASFRGVNPRTAAGYAQNGRRLLLVVIDGRQAGYSVGTTTRETAALLRDLGAREAVNLDGGGSTAMVVRDAASGAIRVVNKPSDAAGERAVANALAVTGRCDTGRTPR
jgi:hypothetical protein